MGGNDACKFREYLKYKGEVSVCLDPCTDYRGRKVLYSLTQRDQLVSEEEEELEDELPSLPPQ